MLSLPAIPTMIWMAFPPEINTSRLMAGAGPAPMLQAAAGWEAFAILLETQADELAASLSALSSAWSGAASERVVAATMPMVMWLRATSLQCQERSVRAAAQAEAYTLALTSTPQLPEIEQNHITNAVLNATNFLGINTVPIAFNEFDYIRMWITAASVMYGYGVTTAGLTATTPVLSPPGIVKAPGMAASTAASAMAWTAMGAAGAVARNLNVTRIAAESSFMIGKLEAGRAASAGNAMANHAQSQAHKAANTSQPNQAQEPTQQAAQQGLQMATQTATQIGSSVAQLPMQMGQMVTQPMQQLVQPLQQMTSLFSSSGADRAQIGMLGTSPFSNHPLAGGNGASSGAGLIRAASLPGAGGTMARTPMMSNLIGKVDVPVPSGAGAGGSGAGLAPVGAGAGGGGPMGMQGQSKKSGGARQGLATPSLLAYDSREEEDDDW